MIASVFFVPDELYADLPETDLLIPFGIVLVLYIITLYFLYAFKPIGKKLFLPLVLISILITVSLPIEYSQPELAFEVFGEYFLILTEGAILAMLYFTDIKKKFI